MKFLFPVAAAMALAAPTMAQTAPQPAAAEPAAEATNDPNRMICKKEKVSGTRLSTKKVCMTAAQWAQRQRDERQATDRAQANRPKSGY